MTLNARSLKEFLYIELLRELDPEWPKGKLIKSESPDFILKMGRKRSVGIEFTDLTVPDTAHRESTKRIGEILKETMGKHFFLQIFFRYEDIQPGLAAEREAALMLGDRIRQLRNNSETTVVIYDGLPESLSMIFMAVIPGLDRSVIESKLSMDVRKISPEMLRSAIQLKEEKIGLYNRRWADRLWLVLTVNGLITPASYNLREKVDQWKISSSFDRTVLFDIAGKKVIEIADY